MIQFYIFAKYLHMYPKYNTASFKIQFQNLKRRLESKVFFKSIFNWIASFTLLSI